jgi:hypothetical protein
VRVVIGFLIAIRSMLIHPGFEATAAYIEHIATQLETLLMPMCLSSPIHYFLPLIQYQCLYDWYKREASVTQLYPDSYWRHDTNASIAKRWPG